MEVLVTYDINTESSDGERRLRRVAKMCEGYGHRVQQSVFECIVSPADYLRLVADLASIIDPATDSVLLYRLREPFNQYVRRLGRDTPFDQRQPFIL